MDIRRYALCHPRFFSAQMPETALRIYHNYRRRLKPIHSIPYSVAQPLERGSNNYYSIIQGRYEHECKKAESGVSDE